MAKSMSAKNKNLPKPSARARVKKDRVKRAARRQNARPMTYDPASLWNPALHQGQPPPVRMTVGRWACVDSIDNLNIQSSTEVDLYFIIPWSHMPVASIYFGKAPGTPPNNMSLRNLSQLQSANPIQVRPLRMSVSMRNLSQAYVRSGLVTVVPFDQPLGLVTTFPTTPGAPVKFTAATGDALDLMFADSTTASQYSGDDFAHGRDFISVPSSYMAYNEFANFAPLFGNVDSLVARADDVHNLLNGMGNSPGSGVPYPLFAGITDMRATYGPATSVPMRGWLIKIAKTAAAQDYVITVRRQDACRAQANTFLSALSYAHTAVSAGSEDLMLRAAHAAGSPVDASTPSPGGPGVSQFVSKFSDPSDMIGQVFRSAAPKVAGRVVAEIAQRARGKMNPRWNGRDEF